MKRIIIILLVGLLQSCENNKYLIIGMDFTDTCSVTSLETLPVVLEDYGFSVYDTKMGYITGKEEDNNYIQLWNKYTGEKIFGFGSIGRGPNEFLMPLCTDIDYNKNIIYVMDLVKCKINKYTLLKDTLECIESFEVPQMTAGSLIRFIDDSTFVYRELDGKIPKLVLYNKQDGMISEYEDNILDEESFDNIFSIYQSAISISKKKKKILLLCYELNAISCFSVKNNTIFLDWRKFLIEPKYDISKREFAIDQNKMDKGIIKHLYVTDLFIYLLIYDAKKSDLSVIDFENNLHKLEYSYIIKMSFEGELIKTYKINCVPMYMVNTLDDKAITVLVNYPDFNLLKLKL
jgi:hypothetical protein